MGEPTPAAFRSLTSAIAGRPDREVIQTVMLRSLTQAKYQVENKGHFGLAYKAYTHFTSPIRRYPDLLVHRAIRYLIRSGEGGNQVVGGPGLVARMRGAAKKQVLPYTPAQMVALGEHCSLTERRADDATRDVVQWLKCQYMQQHLGEDFDGVISGVASFGLFVQIGDLFIEGMVHVANLNSDYYHHDEVRHALVGESTGQRYALGDRVKVKVAAVNIDDRKIDLLVVGKTAGKSKSVREQIASGEFPGKGQGKGKDKAPARGRASGVVASREPVRRRSGPRALPVKRRPVRMAQPSRLAVNPVVAVAAAASHEQAANVFRLPCGGRDSPPSPGGGA